MENFHNNSNLTIKSNVDNYFDKDNRLIRNIEDGVETIYKYDEKGNCIGEIANGVSTIHKYDEKGNKLYTKSSGIDSIIYRCDNFGKVYQSYHRYTKDGDEYYKIKYYEYDEKGNCILIATDSHKEYHRYDENGNMIEVADTAGFDAKYEYDDKGRVVRYIMPKEDYSEWFEYDEKGNMINKINSSNHTTVYNNHYE